MKNLTLAALTALSFLIMSCGQSSTEEKQTKDSTSQNTNETKPVVATASLTLLVEGMSCENCANALKTGLSSVGGVSKCDVNFENKTASIQFDNTKTTEDAIIAQAATVHDGKFKVTKTTSPTVSNTTETQKCEANCTKPCCKGKEGEVKTCTKESKACCKKDMKTN